MYQRLITRYFMTKTESYVVKLIKTTLKYVQ